MASDQLTAAKIRIYAVSPSGDRKKLFQGVNEQTGPAGSPDGVQATVKDNELPYMPRSTFPIRGGARIVATVELTASDGADASDAVINLPVVDKFNNVRMLSRSDLGYTVDLPAAVPVDIEVDLGSGYTVPQNETLYLGGGKYFMSIEDDA